MLFVTTVKATGKIVEMQESPNPKNIDMTIAMRQNAINVGFAPADIEITEMTRAEYEALLDGDPEIIASKARHEEEKDLGSRKVLLSVLFEMANDIRELKGKQPVTKKQFIDNLKSRR